MRNTENGEKGKFATRRKRRRNCTRRRTTTKRRRQKKQKTRGENADCEAEKQEQLAQKKESIADPEKEEASLVRFYPSPAKNLKPELVVEETEQIEVKDYTLEPHPVMCLVKLG